MSRAFITRSDGWNTDCRVIVSERDIVALHSRSLPLPKFTCQIDTPPEVGRVNARIARHRNETSEQMQPVNPVLNVAVFAESLTKIGWVSAFLARILQRTERSRHVMLKCREGVAVINATRGH